jgi:hypothetical protein
VDTMLGITSAGRGVGGGGSRCVGRQVRRCLGRVGKGYRSRFGDLTICTGITAVAGWWSLQGKRARWIY